MYMIDQNYMITARGMIDRNSGKAGRRGWVRAGILDGTGVDPAITGEPPEEQAAPSSWQRPQ
jgi:hypothetical protein